MKGWALHWEGSQVFQWKFHQRADTLLLLHYWMVQETPHWGRLSSGFWSHGGWDEAAIHVGIFGRKCQWTFSGSCFEQKNVPQCVFISAVMCDTPTGFWTGALPTLLFSWT